MEEANEQEVAGADQALQREDSETAFHHLERAHVLAQRMTGRHTFIHWRMLVAGPRHGDLPGTACAVCSSSAHMQVWVEGITITE